MTKLGQFRLKDESPSSGSSLQPGSLFFNRDNATKSSPSLKGKTNLLILRLAKLCWISSIRSIEKFFSNLKGFFAGFCLPCFQASCNQEKNSLTFFFISPFSVSSESEVNLRCSHPADGRQLYLDRTGIVLQLSLTTGTRHHWLSGTTAETVFKMLIQQKLLFSPDSHQRKGNLSSAKSVSPPLGLHPPRK